MPDGSWGKSLALAFDKGEYVSAFAVIGESEQQYANNSEWPNLGLGRHPQRQSCSIEAEAPLALRTYLSPVAIILLQYNRQEIPGECPPSYSSTSCNRQTLFDLFKLDLCIMQISIHFPTVIHLTFSFHGTQCD
ncbi:hypothetical protein Tsp_09599 [Trichinella spiralis]|uniref:hypothetical protein n=1 Tax=Trichinella spiralis TaxID=6334 RepID=UPI0001EFEE4D|nr:hypothetical protein Tsp_09599 [Trichinella spiralis]